ncbi:MAG TPA: amidohydrolase [Puia sp.]|jgi:predicted amidohydrolase YtcJ|nr:amidohydrolase [Puia sp.]
MKNYFLILNIVFCFFIISCTHHPIADRIYMNAKIWTGDSSNPSATAIAIKDSTILFVGNDYQSYVGNNTILKDLGGKMLVPGFTDNHTHFLEGGFSLSTINLRQVKTKQDFIQTFRRFADSLKGNAWIKNGNWDHEAWGGQLPSKEWIDSVSGEHPVFMNRYDGHMGLANSIALKLAGITKDTPNPPGGEIVKDPRTGNPTGILRDGATNLVYRIIPEQSEKEFDKALQMAVAHALSHGFTQVHDMSSFGGWADLATYRRAENANQLPLRIYSFVPIRTWQKLDSFIKVNGWGDDRLRWGGLKGFVDGSLGSTTAWFFKPYLDAPNSTGLQVTDTTLLRKWILGADSVGLHIACHAIGDHANNWILNVYEEAEMLRPTQDHRFRVEHAQHLTPSDIVRFAKLKVIPSMQPYHAIDDGKWAAKRLDSERLKGTYVFRTLLETGANLTFGSDWTVAPLDPIAGIYAAVTRRTLDDKNPGGWFPDQKISVEQALRCYTVNNAWAGFQENKTGKLKSGMLADFTVLSQDLLSIAPENIRDVKVLLTVVGGKEVYSIMSY